MNFYRRNYIEGLFLSSAILGSPDYTMELLVQVVEKLRYEEHFHGYIHLKAIPGAHPALIQRAGQVADRLSVNMELPSNAPCLYWRRKRKKSRAFCCPCSKFNRASRSINKNGLYPAKRRLCTSRTDHPNDCGRFRRKRFADFTPFLCLISKIFYEAGLFFCLYPAQSRFRLPQISQPPMLRENRLYQADWLMRFYGFHAQELLDEANPNF